MASLITSNERQRGNEKKNGIEFLSYISFLKGEREREEASFHLFFDPEASCSVFGSQKRNASLSMDCVITFQAFLVPASHPHEGFCVTFGSFLEAFSVRILP